MKFLNKGQVIFTAMIMLPLMFLVANFFAYFLSGCSILYIIDNWDFFKIFEIIFENHVPLNVKQQGYKALLIGFGISLLLPLISLAALNKNSKRSLHGDAKFATFRDILNSKSVTLGDDKSKGIVVGKYKNKLIRYTKPDFVSIGAGTRSGKGAGVVIPNLLEWQESLIVLDIKQECFNITSKYRRDTLKQEVFLFNPFSFNTHKFNPLHYINLNETEGSTDLMGIAEIIYPTDIVTGAERHFNNAAQSLFIALSKTLWIAIYKKPILLEKHNIKDIFSIGNLFVLYNLVPMDELTATLENALSLNQLGMIESEIAKDAIAKIRSFMLLGDEGKANVISTFEKQLKLFSLPVVKNATDTNSFDFRDLRRKKMTIYLGILPKDLKIASLILNLFFNCAIKINLSENPDFNPDLKHSLLLMLDEFPSIGNISYVKEAAGYIAGYKIQLLTIFQNVSQLNEIYGEQGRKTLLANHSCKVVFAPNEQDDAEYFSREIAYITSKSLSESRNTNQTYTSQGKSKSEAKRALMLPQELKQLPFEEEIILLNGENPIKCEKALYYNDSYFMNKLIALSPTLELHTNQIALSPTLELYINHMKKLVPFLSKLGLYKNKKRLPTKEELGIALSKGELAVNFV